MRRLKVDLEELQMALDDSSPENHYFFDLETGKIALVTDETSGELEEVYAELPEDADSAQIAEAIRQRHLEEWQKEELLQADQVEQGFGTRFVRIEPRDPHADYGDMEDFVETVKHARLRERLSACDQWSRRVSLLQGRAGGLPPRTRILVRVQERGRAPTRSRMAREKRHPADDRFQRPRRIESSCTRADSYSIYGSLGCHPPGTARHTCPEARRP